MEMLCELSHPDRIGTLFLVVVFMDYFYWCMDGAY